MDKAIKILAVAALIIALISVPAYAGAAEFKGRIDDMLDEAHDMMDIIEKTDNSLADDQKLTDAGTSKLSSNDIADMRTELSEASDSLQRWDKRLTKLEDDFSSFRSDYDRTSSQLAAEDRKYLQVDIKHMEDDIDELHRDMDTVRDRVASLRERVGSEARKG
jgi:chromosome segregation ATPase